MTSAGILLLFDRLRCKGHPLDTRICGGAQRISFQLAQRLASRGFKVVFGSDDASNSGPVRQLTANNVMHVRVPFRSPGWLSTPLVVAQLLRIVDREGIGVIHCHDRWTAMFGRCASLISGIDYFYTAHGHFFNRKATAVFFGENVIAVSEAVKRNLTDYFGVAVDHIQVIYNGQDVKPASAEECRAIREKYRLWPGDRIISSIGRLSAEKGHGVLLHALSGVKQKHSQLKCLLVADGDERRQLEQITRDLDLYKNIIFCGRVDDVAPFIQLSEFTVLPSLSEGFGLAALESLLLSVPVVASRTGGIPEVVREGLDGLLVAPKDVDGLAEAIRWMLENPEQARRMGTQGFESVRTKFSGEAMLRAYEKYYAMRLDPHSGKGLLRAS